jgi:hypothetical protein
MKSESFINQKQLQQLKQNSEMRELGGKPTNELQVTKSLKIKPKITEVKSPSVTKIETAERFEKLAEQAIENRDNRNIRMFESAQAMSNVLKDRTLKSNRTQIQDNMQKQVCKNLIDLGFEVNNDKSEQYEGMGSIALINLIFKLLISQRDTINEQGFLLDKALKTINELQQSKKSIDSENKSKNEK